MILIDTNALVLYITGLIDIRLVGKYKRTSIYDECDFEELSSIIGDTSKLVVLPNVWTEVDNLLNRFNGNYKYIYIQTLIQLIKESSEVYLKSVNITDDDFLFTLGITDTLLLRHAPNCNLLITDDSELSDFAIAHSINVFDLKKRKNDRLKGII